MTCCKVVLRRDGPTATHLHVVHLRLLTDLLVDLLQLHLQLQLLSVRGRHGEAAGGDTCTLLLSNPRGQRSDTFL